MTVQELIEMLQDMNPDAEVRLMYQPNYPLESRLQGPVSNTEWTGGEDGEPPSCAECESDNVDCRKSGTQLEISCNDCGATGAVAVEETEEVVYLLEGTPIGYGVRAAWNNV
jgi:hypothetical protein